MIEALDLTESDWEFRLYFFMSTIGINIFIELILPVIVVIAINLFPRIHRISILVIAVSIIMVCVGVCLLYLIFISIIVADF